ncbi:MAG: hypothetical protein CM15mP54_15120 [Paracoccaceae bacterium]|nr:MAG: hypothetical protein CM15mP54_15120 [Paracoccaceae bacterium]
MGCLESRGAGSQNCTSKRDPPTKIPLTILHPKINDITTGKKKNYPHQGGQDPVWPLYNHPEDSPDQNQENCFKAEGKGLSPPYNKSGLNFKGKKPGSAISNTPKAIQRLATPQKKKAIINETTIEYISVVSQFPLFRI